LRFGDVIFGDYWHFILTVTVARRAPCCATASLKPLQRTRRPARKNFLAFSFSKEWFHMWNVASCT
jgi:hypothetical protein